MSTAIATIPMNGAGTLPAIRELKQSFSVDQVREMAESVAQSRLFPGINTVEAAFTLMMLCQAEGLHPMQALKRYHIIEGRPSMRADAMHSEFLDRGGHVEWECMDDTEARAVFSHPVLCPKPLVGSVTFKSLREHGITEGKFGTKDNYKKHPDAMLRARLISKMVRAIDPGAITGMYTPEEVSDFGPSELGPESLADNSAKPAIPDNKSGHGKGAYASPEQVEAYGQALDKVLQHYNAIWADEWCRRNGGQPHDGVKDLLNKWQLDGHLLKWAKETGRLDPSIDADKTQSAKTTKYVAVIYARGKADQAALKAEIKRYAAERTDRETEALLKKFPDLKGPDDQEDEETPGGDEHAEPVVESWRSLLTAAADATSSPRESFEIIACELLDALVNSKAISPDYEDDERLNWDRIAEHLEHYFTRDPVGFKRSLGRATAKLKTH